MKGGEDPNHAQLEQEHAELAQARVEQQQARLVAAEARRVAQSQEHQATEAESGDVGDADEALFGESDQTGQQFSDDPQDSGSFWYQPGSGRAAMNRLAERGFSQLKQLGKPRPGEPPLGQPSRAGQGLSEGRPRQPQGTEGLIKRDQLDQQAVAGVEQRVRNLGLVVDAQYGSSGNWLLKRFDGHLYCLSADGETLWVRTANDRAWIEVQNRQALVDAAASYTQANESTVQISAGGDRGGGGFLSPGVYDPDTITQHTSSGEIHLDEAALRSRQLAGGIGSTFRGPDGQLWFNTPLGRSRFDERSKSWSPQVVSYDDPSFQTPTWRGWLLPTRERIEEAMRQHGFAPDPLRSSLPPILSSGAETGQAGGPFEPATQITPQNSHSLDSEHTQIIENRAELLSEDRVGEVVTVIDEIAPQFDPQGEEGVVDIQQVYAAFDGFDATLEALAANRREEDLDDDRRVLEQLGLPSSTVVTNIREDAPELFADCIITRLHEARRGQEMTLREMHQQEVDLIAQRDQISTPGVTENDQWRTLNVRIESLQVLERQLNTQFLESAIPGLQRLDTATQVPLLITAVEQARRDGNIQPVNDMLEQLAQAIAELSIPYNVSASDDTLVPSKFTAAQLPTAEELLDKFGEFEANNSRDGHYAVNEQVIEGRPFLTLAQPREDLDDTAEVQIRRHVLDVLSDRVPALEGEALQELVDRVGQNNQAFLRVLMPFVRAASAGVERDEKGIQAVQRLFAARRDTERFAEEAQEILQLPDDGSTQRVLESIQHVIVRALFDDDLFGIQACLYHMLHLANEYRNSTDSSQPIQLPALALMMFAANPEYFNFYVDLHYDITFNEENAKLIEGMRNIANRSSDQMGDATINQLRQIDEFMQRIADGQRLPPSPSQ